MTTTNSSCLGSSSLLCRELVPVGYYQRPGRSEIFWWEWCALAGSLAASRWPSMKYETETTDHLSLLHLVFYILVKKKKIFDVCLHCPWEPQSIMRKPYRKASEQFLSEEHRFPKQGLSTGSWRTSLDYLGAPYTFEVFGGWQTLLFLYSQEQYPSRCP